MTDSPRPCGPDWLHDRLAGGGIVFLDGATGTELERRGVPMHEVAWSGACILEHGDVLGQVHEDYIHAGADVIITNTFSTARHMLEPAGLGEQVEAINRRAAEIALQARDRVADRPVAVAGSVAEFLGKTEDPRWLAPAALRATFEEQANTLAEAGVDLIVLEMMQRAEVAEVAIDAALATGLPVWVGMSCRSRNTDGRLMTFDFPDRPFEEVVKMAAAKPVAVLTVMHSEVPDTGPGLDLVRRHWGGVVGAYPNSGYFKMPNWQFVDVITPADLVGAASGWIAQGVQIIGGCCGIGPAHIRALVRELPSAISARS